MDVVAVFMCNPLSMRVQKLQLGNCLLMQSFCFIWEGSLGCLTGYSKAQSYADMISEFRFLVQIWWSEKLCTHLVADSNLLRDIGKEVWET